MAAREILADMVMLAHAGFSAFLLAGLALVISGAVLGWRWTSSPLFRRLHLAAACLLLVRLWTGMPCPLSVAEDGLRRQTAAECPLGAAFHERLHRLAFRGAETRPFSRSAMLTGFASITAFVVTGRKHVPQAPFRS